MRTKPTREPNGAASIYKGGDGKWHGRVTIGIRADGKPDRRHVERKTRTEVVKAVREIERKRDEGKLRKAGETWTLGGWLEHWVREIAQKYVAENTYDGYEVDVRVHLVPGIGAHRLDRLEPEHLEAFYAKMQRNGSKAATAHHVHRTVRVALAEALRRGHVARNVAEIARAPRIEEDEVEPFSIEEVQSLLLEGLEAPEQRAVGHRPGARPPPRGSSRAALGRRGPRHRLRPHPQEQAPAEVPPRLR